MRVTQEKDRARAALCLCLAGLDRDRTVEALAELSPAGWERLVAISASHGVEPLLYRGIKRLGGDVDIPGAAAKRPRASYETNTIKNLRLEQQLAGVLDALHDDGVDVIVLKGAHLARAVYGDIGLRSMSDIDLLMREEYLDTVQRRMLAMGYSQPRFTRDDLKHLYPFTKAGAVPVEAHWTLDIEPDALVANRAKLWDRAQPITFGGVEALALCPEDLLVHVCHHAARHGFIMGLRPLCDIAEMVRAFGNRLDWDRVRERARLFGVEHSVFLALVLVRKLLGPVVPEAVTSHFDDGRSVDSVIAHATMQIHFAERGQHAADTNPSAQPSRLRLLRNTLFPPPATMRVIYQTNNLLLAYLIRPFDLFSRYTRLGQKLFKRGQTREGSVAERMKTLHNTNVIREWIMPGQDGPATPDAD